MKIISGRADIKPILEKVISVYEQSGNDAFIESVHNAILKRKIRYPILEYAAQELYKYFPEAEQVNITDRVIALNENGSEVIAGKILQLRLADHYDESINKAVEYIIHGSNWLPCDTIGERVFGHALLVSPEKTILVLKQLSHHDNKWVIRSIGVAVHYAVKKGLKKQYADEMFRLLLSFAGTTEFHIKKGIGWAAKTIAKFHPDIIASYEERLNNDVQIKQWFKTKIMIGLGRTYKYAGRYTS